MTDKGFTIYGAVNRRERRAIESIIKKIPKPTEKETPIMNEKSKPSTYKHWAVEPEFIHRLRDAGMSNTDIGDGIGCSSSHVSNMLSGASEIAQSYEMAAELLYKKKYGHVSNVVSIVTVPTAHHATLAQMISAVGGSVKKLEV